MLSLALPSHGSAHTQCGHSVLCFIFEVVLMSDSSCYASLFSERPGHCHVWIKLILAILEIFVSKWLRLLSGWVAVAK